MDLSDIKLDENSNNGVAMQLRHPLTNRVIKHDGKQMAIKLLGSDSDVFRRKIHEIRKRQIERKDEGDNFNQTKEESCELLAACTVGFENILMNGELLEFSECKAFDLYMTQSWIRDDVDKFIGSRANFF